jgi:hypothetical protein
MESLGSLSPRKGSHSFGLSKYAQGHNNEK